MPDHNITTCSLCGHRVATENLSQHRETELKQIEKFTIQMIKRSHPEWDEGGDVCTQCWDH